MFTMTFTFTLHFKSPANLTLPLDWHLKLAFSMFGHVHADTPLCSCVWTALGILGMLLASLLCNKNFDLFDLTDHGCFSFLMCDLFHKKCDLHSEIEALVRQSVTDIYTKWIHEKFITTCFSVKTCQFLVSVNQNLVTHSFSNIWV